ncbi:hypothetical protein KIPB_008139 [Kipferlia bialata]|uniref:Uncharacterized protein n=1 Tax=Kipferlia bialata TaxID=797122 RepID=A0A9K3GL72_9EUKA|nr:hypothetical protein KIPB_008139 [Kipferlia bialata]|eukprot:g8139.t1
MAMRVGTFFKGVLPCVFVGFAALFWVMINLWTYVYPDAPFDARYQFISNLGNHEDTPYWWVFSLALFLMAFFLMFYPAYASKLMVHRGLVSADSAAKGGRISKQVTLLRVGAVGLACIGVFSEDFEYMICHSGGMILFFLIYIWIINYDWIPMVIRTLKGKGRGPPQEGESREGEGLVLGSVCPASGAKAAPPAPTARSPLVTSLLVLVCRLVQNAQVLTLFWYLGVSFLYGQPKADCDLWDDCEYLIASASIYEWLLMGETFVQLGLLPVLVAQCNPAHTQADMPVVSEVAQMA